MVASPLVQSFPYVAWILLAALAFGSFLFVVLTRQLTDASPGYVRFTAVMAAVLALVTRNREIGSPVDISIGLRSDRPLADVLRDPDLQQILEHKPGIDFTWSFTSAGGRITREALPPAMRLRVVSSRPEPCVQLYNGPMVLPDGIVIACGCVASMDALADLAIGNVLEENLGEVWRNRTLHGIRDSFGTDALNATCRSCDMYRDLELYRTGEGRRRAAISRRRGAGEHVRREDASQGAFAGG